MKKSLLISLCFVSCFAFSQNQEQPDSLVNYSYNMADSADYTYLLDSFGARFYNVDGCCPGFVPVPGQPVPEHLPYAKHANDTSMWEWKTVKLADFWEERIYDLKPQYKDTLTRNDGSVIEVPIWVKYPGWSKGE